MRCKECKQESGDFKFCGPYCAGMYTQRRYRQKRQRPQPCTLRGPMLARCGHCPVPRNECEDRCASTQTPLTCERSRQAQYVNPHTGEARSWRRQIVPIDCKNCPGGER